MTPREPTPPDVATAQLTPAEQRYLADLGRLPRSHRARALGWLLELAPGIALFAYGLAKDDRTFLVLGFASQLYFSVWRMVAQYRGARMLMSIRHKEASSRETST